MAKVLEIKAIYQAHAGAEKMDRQGYRYERDVENDRVAWVYPPAGGRYRVNVQAGKGYCTCPFYFEEKICKHRIWLNDNMNREEVEVASLEEKYFGAQNAYAEYLDTLEQ